MRFGDFIANISGLEQDIVDRKTALQTAITPVHAYQNWRTFNFGPTNGEKIVLIRFSFGHKWQK